MECGAIASRMGWIVLRQDSMMHMWASVIVLMHLVYTMLYRKSSDSCTTP